MIMQISLLLLLHECHITMSYFSSLVLSLIAMITLCTDSNRFIQRLNGLSDQTVVSMTKNECGFVVYFL